MLKLTFCLHRLAHLSRAEFQSNWRDHHAPLVASHAETLSIKRYLQNHAETHAANDAARASRDAPEMFDGVAELWWESWEAYAAVGQKPGAADAALILLEDERKFIDLNRSPLWFGVEHTIVGGK